MKEQPLLEGNENYWKQRCEAAEAFIEASPGDPDITIEQLEAYGRWLEISKSSPPSAPVLQQGDGESNKVETFDLSDIPHEQKMEFLNGLTLEVAKNYLSAFISLGLKTHIEQMVIEETTGQEYILTFRTLQDHLKKMNNETFPAPKPTPDIEAKAREWAEGIIPLDYTGNCDGGQTWEVMRERFKKSFIAGYNAKP